MTHSNKSNCLRIRIVFDGSRGMFGPGMADRLTLIDNAGPIAAAGCRLAMRFIAPMRVSAISLAVLLGATAAAAAELKVAVAANFTDPMKALAPLFEESTGHKLVLSYGSTGQIFAQIKQAAPFEVFLAADKATPTKAVAEGLAVVGTQFTYAVGKLALYSKTPGLVTGEETLQQSKFDKLAIANPATAPYGAAAVDVMKALGVHKALEAKIVQGQNIGQTFQFVETGNAETGFVALAQIARVTGGSRWVVPEGLHPPILQDAVLLKAGDGNPAARAFLDFLKSKEVRAVIEAYGYGVGG